MCKFLFVVSDGKLLFMLSTGNGPKMIYYTVKDGEDTRPFMIILLLQKIQPVIFNQMFQFHVCVHVCACACMCMYVFADNIVRIE